MTLGTDSQGDRSYFRRLLTNVPAPIGGAVYFAAPAPPPRDAHSFAREPRLLVCLQGVGRYRLPGRPAPIDFQAGDAIVLPADTWIANATSRRYASIGFVYGRNFLRLYHLDYRPRGCSSAFRPDWAHKTSQILPGLNRDGRLLLDLLLDAADRDDSAAAVHLIALLLLTARDLLQQPPPKPPGKARQTWRAITLYLEDALEQPLTRDDVGRVFRLHPNHISRLCRRFAGVEFRQYLRRLRIDRAKHYLEATDLPVKAIAFHCGFNSADVFIRACRRELGLPPGRWRRRRRGGGG